MPRLDAYPDLLRPLSPEFQQGQLAFGTDYRFKISYLFYPAAQVFAHQLSPLLFIFPGISGITALDRHAAKYFAHHGYSVVIAPYGVSDSPQSFENVAPQLAEMVLANFAVVDYFSRLPGIDGARMGILGTSFGGIRGLYHSFLDARIKAHIFLVTAPLPDVLAYSPKDRVAALRLRQMRAGGYASPQVYRDAIEKAMHFKLSDWTCRRSPQDYFLYIANKDDTVPSFLQWRLLQTLGNPQFRATSLSHVNASAWNMLRHLKEMREYFNWRLQR
jgi:dienelactone hydrolase